MGYPGGGELGGGDVVEPGRFGGRRFRRTRIVGHVVVEHRVVGGVVLARLTRTVVELWVE